MAGDWMKLEKATPEKPEVFAIASKMALDPDAVVGKLIRLWSWFDSHTVDGNAKGVTLALLDRIVGNAGFAESVMEVGWMSQTEDGVVLPNFDRHNGKTAKVRAQTSKRVSNHRNCNGSTVTQPLENALPEKRREEKRSITPKPPKGDSDELKDPRHQEFIAIWDELYFERVGEKAVYNPREFQQLSALLMRAKDLTAERFRGLIITAKRHADANPYCTYSKKSTSLGELCANYSNIRDELVTAKSQKDAQNGSHMEREKPAFSM